MSAPFPSLHFSDLQSKPKRNAFFSSAEASRLYYTYNGRGAIYQVLRCLPESQGRSVLVPAFHCPTVVDPILRAGYRVIYYEITPDLKVDCADVLRKLSDDVAAVVLINYFGFPADIDPILADCRASGALIIEDCSQAHGVECSSRFHVALFTCRSGAPQAGTIAVELSRRHRFVRENNSALLPPAAAS